MISGLFFSPSQISLRWTPSVSLGINWPASPSAASTSSMPSKSPKTSRPLPMISCPPWFTSFWRGTPHACSPTSSTSLASATPAGWWLERMDIISPTWWVLQERWVLDSEICLWFGGRNCQQREIWNESSNSDLGYLEHSQFYLLSFLCCPKQSFALFFFITLNPLFEKSDVNT